MRVSSSMITDSNINAVQKNEERLAKIREKIAENKNFIRPSDSPQAMKESLGVKISIQEESRYLGTIDTARASLEASQSTLSEIGNQLNSMREVAIEGANGSLAQSDRDILADHVNQALEHLASLTKEKHQNQYLFGGTETAEEPFSFTRDDKGQIIEAKYLGNEEIKNVPIGKNETISMNIPGNTAFSDSFDSLVKLRDLLQNKAGLPEQEQLQGISDTLSDLTAASEQTSSNLAQTGQRIAYLEDQSLAHEDTKANKESRLSQIEDLDLPSAVVEMTKNENAYQAALYIVSRSSQSGGLLDFMT